MRLTRRGWTVAGVGIGAFVLAIGFGARSLNAVVVPSVVALIAGYIQVRFLRDVTVVRDSPGDDFAGQQGVTTVGFHDGDGEDISRPFLATVREHVGDGIRVVPREAASNPESLSPYSVGSDDDGEYAAFETAVGSHDLQYAVEYEQRGERTLGPASLRATDVFGLMQVEVPVRGTTSVLVYPRVYRLSPWGQNPLRRLEEYGRSRQREEFEELREYSPGDPLRDIHWKTTAKRDDLVVKEFAAESEAETVTISGGATPGSADRMAEAVASLAVALVEEGIPVEVSTAQGTVEVGPKRGGLRRLLRTLALVTPGRNPNPDADVVVHAEEGTAVVAVAGGEYRFGDLVSGAEIGSTLQTDSPGDDDGTTTDDSDGPMEATA
jgi:uncharacterized protein (DUF58 family)